MHYSFEPQNWPSWSHTISFHGTPAHFSDQVRNRPKAWSIPFILVSLEFSEFGTQLWFCWKVWFQVFPYYFYIHYLHLVLWYFQDCFIAYLRKSFFFFLHQHKNNDTNENWWLIGRMQWNCGLVNRAAKLCRCRYHWLAIERSDKQYALFLVLLHAKSISSFGVAIAVVEKKITKDHSWSLPLHSLYYCSLPLCWAELLQPIASHCHHCQCQQSWRKQLFVGMFEQKDSTKS